MAQYNKENLFVKVPVTNINNYSENIDLYGQIAFLDGSNANNDITYGKFSYLYAQGNSFGDGAFSNKTVITKNIMVSGGPLASLVGDKYKDGIAAGTDLESLLVSLFSKVLFPTITKSVSGKAQFSIDMPSLNYKNGNNNTTSGNMYPVNTVLTLDKTPISEYNVTLPTRQIIGITYGFKYYGINNQWIDSNNETSYSVSWENNSVSDVSYNFDATYTGFIDSSYVSIAQENNIAYISSSLKLGLGENKIIVTAYAEASNFTASCPEIPEIIMYANDGSTGNTEFKDEDGKLGKIKKISSASETVTPKPGKTTPRLDTTSTSSFYGVYPFKFNGIEREYSKGGTDNVTHDGKTINQFTPTGKYNTTNNSVDLCINYGDSTIDNKDAEAKKYKFYIPKDYTVSNFVAYASDPDSPNAWDGNSITISYTITEDSDLINNRYEFNVTGAEAKYCGIRIKFNWKF